MASSGRILSKAVSPDGSELTITLGHHFVFDYYPSFRSITENALAHGRIRTIVIDLWQTGHIDNAGIGMLLDLIDRANERGVRVKLANVNDAGLATVFRFIHLGASFGDGSIALEDTDLALHHASPDVHPIPFNE